MNIALVWFTCEKDLPFFLESTKNISTLREQAKEHNIITYCVLDKKDNKKFHDICDKTIISNWDRMGALRGMPQFEAELKLYTELFQKHNLDVIIKVDSDVIINDINLLTSIDYNKVAYFSGAKNETFPFGELYCLSKVGLKILTQLWSRVDIRGRLYNLDDYKESIAIYRMIKMSGVCYGTVNGTEEKNGTILVDYDTKEHKHYDEMTKYNLIYFRSSHNKTNGETNRAIIRMKNFNKYKDENS